MKDNVFDLPRNKAGVDRPPITDYWFAQVDNRLNEIERYVRRLEWHIWLVVCGIAALLVLSIVQTIAPQ